MSGLNEDQKRAAMHRNGHAIVLAGPGTGKTSTLITRHSFLLSQKVPSQSIFMTTFTQKAAEEIKSRLGDRAGTKPWIGTFHSHCLRLLKRFSEEAHLPKNFKVIDPYAQQRILKDLNIDWNQDDGDLLDMISRWKDAMLTPEAAMAEAVNRNNPIDRKAAEHFEAYERHLEQISSLDFSDLMGMALRLLQTSAVVKDYVRKTFLHALVDEFQDVNRIQLEILMALVACGTKLWAVGDDDQALYGWRGSNVFYTVNFDNYFTPSAKYTLKTNYRCDPAILRAATVLISNNRHRVRKELKAARAHSGSNVVRVSAFKDEREEATQIAASIESFVSKGARPRDIGILVRTASMTVHIQQALELRNISMSLTGAQNFWDSQEVKAFSDLLEAIEKGDQKAGYKYKGGAALIDAMRGKGPKNASLPVAQFLASHPPAGSSTERIASWADAIEAICVVAKDFDTANAFAEHAASLSSKVSTQAIDGVAVTTIHSAKGLEYRHVFIAGCEAGIMPHRKSTDPEEERRLFYVALTRSKGAVDVSFARMRSNRKQNPSPYLAEINAAGSHCVVWSASAKDDIERIAKSGDKPAAVGKHAVAAVEAAQTPAATKPGQRKIYYRKDGSKTLIPPGDE